MTETHSVQYTFCSFIKQNMPYDAIGDKYGNGTEYMFLFDLNFHCHPRIGSRCVEGGGTHQL